MAIELGYKVVTDTETYNDYAIGITLPLQKGDGYFRQSFTSREQVRTNLLSLLLTKPGERVMQPELNSGLYQLIFENKNDIGVDGLNYGTGDLERRIEDVISSSIARWLPYLTIEEILVESKASNQIGITINFSINGVPGLESVSFSI